MKTALAKPDYDYRILDKSKGERLPAYLTGNYLPNQTSEPAIAFVWLPRSRETFCMESSISKK